MNRFDANRLRDIYAEIQGAETLLRSASPRQRLSAATVYAAAQNVDAMPASSPSLRRAYGQMVARAARAALPFARAASSGAAARRGDGCQIRIEQSRAEPDQYFVLVELAKEMPANSAASLVVCDRDDRCRRFPLPAARDGVAQIIAEAGSDLMRMISDPAAKVYLR